MASDNTVLKKPGRRPVLAAVRAVGRVVPSAKPRIQKGLIRAAYDFISARAKGPESIFMNFGYASLDGENPDLQLTQTERDHRYSVYLYHRVGQQVDLKDRDVLEVGCGRGGGSAFLKRHFAARSVTGIDFAGRAIDFCKRNYLIDGLDYRVGDAEHIPFGPASFDVVASVESSHCYPDMDAFLREADRVLRPNGHLLIADFRNEDEFDQLRAQFARAGFSIVADESISKNVVHALDLDADRRARTIRQNVLRPVRRTFLEFTGVPGSRIYADFSSGQVDYRCMALVKR